MIVAVIIFAAVVKITGHPIQNKIMGESHIVGESMYNNSVKELKRGLCFLDIKTSKYKKGSIAYEGMNEFIDTGKDGDEHEVKINYETYIATIPTTINFALTGNKEINIKMVVWKFNKKNNSSEALDRIGKESALLYKYLWTTDEQSRFGVNKNLDNLMDMILKEVQADYDKNNGLFPFSNELDIHNYLCYYFANKIGSTDNGAMVKFGEYLSSNYSYYNGRYPLIFNENNNDNGKIK